MVGGYYTQYLSTILKGPWATSIKERIEARKTINNLRVADKKIYDELPQLVEKEHRVTKASKEEDKVIKELKMAAAKGYSLAFNVSTMDIQILEAVDSLIEVMKKIHAFGANAPRGSVLHDRIEKLSQLFVQLMQRAIKKAKDEERWEYKYVMIIVDQSANKNHEQFMNAVRVMFQKLDRQSRLAKFAIRADIGRERHYYFGIVKLTERCKALLKEVEKDLKKNRREAIERVIRDFEIIIQESAFDVEKAFYHAYLIKKRDFLLILKLIANIEVLKGMNRKWLMRHFMPSEMTQKKNIKLSEIEGKVAKEFHTIAQALRISMVRIERLNAQVAQV